jgi:hypothetical protein
MKLKQLGLLSLSILIIHSGSALSVDDVLNQIKSHFPGPLSVFQASEDLHEKPVHPDEHIAHKTAVPEFFPCCICRSCKCSRTSCPQFRPFPSPPEVNWANCSSYDCPPKIAEAGCGAQYSLDACLSFVQQYLQALEPALEFASNHSHESAPASGEKKEDKKKLLCCGEGCTDSQCLGYLATAVKNLQAPINGTLDSGEYNQALVSEEGEGAKSEL